MKDQRDRGHSTEDKNEKHLLLRCICVDFSTKTKSVETNTIKEKDPLWKRQRGTYKITTCKNLWVDFRVKEEAWPVQMDFAHTEHFRPRSIVHISKL